MGNSLFHSCAEVARKFINLRCFRPLPESIRLSLATNSEVLEESYHHVTARDCLHEIRQDVTQLVEHKILASKNLIFMLYFYSLSLLKP